jgi:hypothetical protein
MRGPPYLSPSAAGLLDWQDHMDNPWDATKEQAERKKSEEDFRANFERLKAERLARQGEPQGTGRS